MDATNESESSLPTQAAVHMPSSPPSFTANKASESAMDANQDHVAPNGDANSNTNTKASPIVISFGRPSRSRTGSEETERPASGQPRQHSEATTENEEMVLDSAEPIDTLDWDNLAERYHSQMAECEKKDAALMEEWENLMAFFRIWAESGNVHETERTYHRLYTRMAHVQNSESKLEKTRQHYTSVVRAFENTMYLADTESVQIQNRIRFQRPSRIMSTVTRILRSGERSRSMREASPMCEMHLMRCNIL